MKSVQILMIGKRLSIEFTTNKNGTFAPSITTSGSTPVWYVSGEAPQVANPPSFTLDGTDRIVKLVVANFKNISSIVFSNQGIKGAFDASLLTDCTFFDLANNTLLDAVTNPTNTTIVTSYAIGGTAIASLDLSVFTNISGTINAALCSSLTTLTLGSSSQVITSFDFTDCDITGSSDLSGYTSLGGDFRMHLNANLTDVIFPITSQNFSRIWIYGTSTGVLNWADLSGVVTDILILNNAYTSAESDENIVLIANNINITSSNINIAGTNAALTNGSVTGFDGLSAKDTLIAAGNTVTYN